VTIFDALSGSGGLAHPFFALGSAVQIIVYDFGMCALRASAFNSGMLDRATCQPFMEFGYERPGVVCILSLFG